jgi:mevalonate kinase
LAGDSRPSSVAGKAFILGEYGVLADRPALVAAVGPRFRAHAATAGQGTTEFHPQSPAGRLLAWARSRGLADPGLRIEDPHHGAGGFGASTAQFALLYRRLASEAGFEPSALGARKMYRELMADSAEGMPPSGADLVAQWSGGVSYFEPAKARVRSVWEDFDWGDLLVFSATALPGRKVATLEHLAALKGSGLLSGLVSGESRAPEHYWVGALSRVVEDAVSSPGDQAGLGRAMSRYADLLATAGLELPAAREDRLALASLPGVLGAKGCGALLSDAVVALVSAEADAAHREAVIRAALSRGLVLVADGLVDEEGITP